MCVGSGSGSQMQQALMWMQLAQASTPKASSTQLTPDQVAKQIELAQGKNNLTLQRASKPANDNAAAAGEMPALGGGLTIGRA